MLAYSTIENAGIILMALGGAMVFRSYDRPLLAAVALAACLFHIFNHAVFKSLLFLSAGAVVHATETRNMERMGGLIRRMPLTALCFLVGAVAISGLPPLNGFVSEWLTYQALLGGFGSTPSLTRIVFPIAGSLLALTGALAAACFVRAFGIGFLALPRSSQAAHAHEAHPSMLAGMGALAALCIALGLGATLWLPILDPLVNQLVNTKVSGNLVLAGGVVLSSGSPKGGTVAPAALAGVLVLLALVPGAAVGGLVASRSQSSRPDLGLRPAGVDGGQRIYGYRLLQTATDDLCGVLSTPPRDPDRVRSVCLLPNLRPV